MSLLAPAPLAEVVRLGALPAGDAPAWLDAPRRRALEWVVEHGFPTRHHEDWRYLRLEPVLATAFRVPGPPADGRDVPGGELGSGSDLAGSDAGSDRDADRDDQGADRGVALDAALESALAGLADLGGPRLVFVNGRFAPRWSRLDGLPGGAAVGSLARLFGPGGSPARGGARLEAVEPASDPAFGIEPGGYVHAFAALNAALFIDGAVVELGEGVVLDQPIHVAHLTIGGDEPRLVSPRSVIVAGAGSRVSVVETHQGVAGSPQCVNAQTAVWCGASAQVDYHRLQDEPDNAFHFSRVAASLAPAGRFSCRTIGLGAAVARHEVEVDLDGEGAEACVDGLYLPRGQQYHDHPVLVVHGAARTTSRQLFKGVVAGAGHGVFNGRVVVRPGADGTDAVQSNLNLLLSRRAEVDTRPRLEIFADDVQCAHGAAVGRLDPDAVFYLRSRGVPRREAEHLLVRAFADEIVQRIPAGALRDQVTSRVDACLEEYGEDPS